jgi:hypothetical protein
MTTSFFDKIKLKNDTLVNNKCIIDNIQIQDKVLNLKNLIRFTKKLNESSIFLNNTNNISNNSLIKQNNKNYSSEKKIEKYYYIKQKDTLFWCFYILKNGFSSYEMNCNNQYFTIEKQEKYKYIEYLRQEKNKNLLKMFKIKPLLDLENDLANKDNISIKTFFGLCLIEGINIILVDNRKIYELICNDNSKINVIHFNSSEYYIEVEPNDIDINKYRKEYFIMPSFDYKLKSITSYKVDDLIELCSKLNISLENNKSDKKKLLKKDIYEIVCQQFR